MDDYPSLQQKAVVLQFFTQTPNDTVSGQNKSEKTVFVSNAVIPPSAIVLPNIHASVTYYASCDEEKITHLQPYVLCIEKLMHILFVLRYPN